MRVYGWRIAIGAAAILAVWAALVILPGCIPFAALGGKPQPTPPPDPEVSEGPFGLAWGVSMLGLAAGLFALGLFLAVHNTLASTVCTGLAVVLAPMGAVLLASKVVSWGAMLIAAVAVCLLLVLAVTLIIRQWQRVKNLVSDEPNTPETNAMVAQAKKANGGLKSSSPSPAPTS